jgi:phosphoribosylformimino-5-aminoimidazole carboxamide ribotide isomerase
MRIIPVIDVMNGQAVRAVGGRREMYQPIRSRLTTSTDPLEVAEALLQAAGSDELYLADIDALLGHRPHLNWVKSLTDRGIRVMVDAGLKVAEDAIPIAATGASVVVGTETLSNFRELATLVQAWEPDRVWLSIDMRNGVVLGAEGSPTKTAARAVALGVTRLLVLELARVGTGLGTGTVALCSGIRSQFPEIELLAGGGIRNQADVDALTQAGASGVLVASALHDGALRPH